MGLEEAVAAAAASLKDSLSLFDKPAATGTEEVAWSIVKKAADEVSKQATVAGIFWNNNVEEDAGLENIRALANSLNGFVLLCHASTVEAGPTLLHNLHTTTKRIVETSFDLLTYAVSFKGKKEKSPSRLPTLAGHVWEACEALKKIRLDNYSAISEGLLGVIESIGDVARELGEFELENSITEDIDEVDNNLENASSSDNSEDLNQKLSPQEMQLVQSIARSLHLLLDIMKHLPQVLKHGKKVSSRPNEAHLALMEIILELTKLIGLEVDEVGASLYPPQDVSILQERIPKMDTLIENLWKETSSILAGIVPDKLRLMFDKLRESEADVVKLLNEIPN